MSEQILDKHIETHIEVIKVQRHSPNHTVYIEPSDGDGSVMAHLVANVWLGQEWLNQFRDTLRDRDDVCSFKIPKDIFGDSGEIVYWLDGEQIVAVTDRFGIGSRWEYSDDVVLNEIGCSIAHTRKLLGRHD